MIRDAVESDIPQIVELGRKFLLEGPYKDIIEDHPEVPTELAHKLLDLSSARVLVLENGEKIEGVLAFIIYPHFYSGMQTAQELIWYVLPEARHKAFDVLAMVRMAQRLAKQMGAKYMQFTAPTPDVGLLYEHMGYKQIEVGYQKELI